MGSETGGNARYRYREILSEKGADSSAKMYILQLIEYQRSPQADINPGGAVLFRRVCIRVHRPAI